MCLYYCDHEVCHVVKPRLRVLRQANSEQSCLLQGAKLAMRQLLQLLPLCSCTAVSEHIKFEQELKICRLQQEQDPQ